MSWKSSKYFILSVYVAFVIQHTVCMSLIMLSSVACLGLQYFSPLSHKWHDFQKKLLNKMCVLIFSTTFVWNIFHSKKCSARYYKCTFLSDFNETWIFSTDFVNLQISNFMKNCPVGAELLHAARQTDGQAWRTVTFHNFANAPKNAAFKL